MKKIALLLMLLISTYVCAQNSNTTFGIKSGINLSKYSPEIFVGGQRLADYQFNLGFYVGGFSNIEISEKVKIQPELLLYTQGTKISDSRFEMNITEYVISLPVTLQYFISEKINLEGGLQLGFIVDRKDKIIEDPFSNINQEEITPTDFDKFDFGINIGVGYNLSESLRLNSRYFIGILERDDIIKSRVLSFGLEYKL
jgi:hypothetical protein